VLESLGIGDDLEALSRGTGATNGHDVVTSSAPEEPLGSLLDLWSRCEDERADQGPLMIRVLLGGRGERRNPGGVRSDARARVARFVSLQAH